MRIMLILSLSLVLLWGYVLWRAARNEARAEASFPARGTQVQVDDVTTHAWIEGDGPDVVLIHGSSGNINDMTFALAPELVRRGYRVIALDRPGLGYSDPIAADGGTIAQQATHLMRAARILGADRPIVLGQSYGGAVALAWAAHHPEALSGLVPVAAAAIPWETPLDPLYRVTSTTIGSALVVPLLTAFVPNSYVANTLEAVFAPQPVPPAYAAHFGIGLSLRRLSMRQNARQRAALLEQIIEMQPQYPSIRAPTEIVHGNADKTVNFQLHAETLARQIPSAQLTVLEGIGHMPHHVATKDIADAVDRVAQRAGLR